MSDNPPDFPSIAASDMAAIVEWATSCAEWTEMDALVASQHGHDPQASLEGVAGLRFPAKTFTDLLNDLC